MFKEYKSVELVTPSLLKLRARAGIGEFCEITLADGGTSRGRVIAADTDSVYIRTCGGRINPSRCAVRFTGTADRLSVSPDMTGRIFDGIGRPADGFGRIISDVSVRVHGEPQTRKSLPADCVITGITAIDAFSTLLEGQSLTVVVPRGVPHGEFVSALATNASPEFGDEKFTVVFAMVGADSEDLKNYTEDFACTGSFERTVFISNLAQDSSEAYDTPHTALAVAEYLAFGCGKRVLCIIDGLSEFAGSLNEYAETVSAALGEKKIKPDISAELAAIYARAGKKEGERGSVTLVSVITEGDTGESISEITDKLSDEQIYLSGELYGRGIYPPVDVCSPFAARRPKEREGHQIIFSRLAEYYSKGKTARKNTEGGEFTDEDRAFADFADGFENKIITQNLARSRTIEQAEAAGQKLLSIIGDFLPKI